MTWTLRTLGLVVCACVRRESSSYFSPVSLYSQIIMALFLLYFFLIGDIGTKSCIHPHRLAFLLRCLVKRDKTPSGFIVGTDHIEAFVQVSSDQA